MSYRPDNWVSIADKNYELSNTFIEARRSRNTLLTERLLILGYCVLCNRWEEDMVDGELVWKSTIYPEDYAEASKSTIKNTLQVFRENYRKVLATWVELDGIKHNIVLSCTYENCIITIYWNPAIINHIAMRANLLNLFSGV